MIKNYVSLLLFVLLLGLVACSSDQSNEDLKTIRIGATAGPYSDQVKDSIEPLLKKEGYVVEITEFNDYIQPNKALHEGDIDVNIYQNPTYLEQYNEDHQMDLVVTIPVPTIPIALYSSQYSSIDKISEGMKVTVPDDPSNISRSLYMLEEYGWIELKADISPTKASLKDIKENKYHLEIVPIEAAQLPRSLEEVDYSLINGNFALASGLKLEDAVEIEKTPEHYMIYLTFRKEDVDKEIANALKQAYESEEFLQYTNEHLQGFVKPLYQLEMEGK